MQGRVGRLGTRWGLLGKQAEPGSGAALVVLPATGGQGKQSASSAPIPGVLAVKSRLHPRAPPLALNSLATADGIVPASQVGEANEPSSEYSGWFPGETRVFTYQESIPGRVWEVEARVRGQLDSSLRGAHSRRSAAGLQANETQAIALLPSGMTSAGCKHNVGIVQLVLPRCGFDIDVAWLAGDEDVRLLADGGGGGG